jgi:hypothetical protein
VAEGCRSDPERRIERRVAQHGEHRRRVSAGRHLASLS